MKKNIIILAILAIILIGSVSFNYFLRLRPLGQNVQDPLLKEIKTRGKIIIGTEAAYPPMESIDEKGDFVGMDIDIARKIALDLGIKGEFQNIPWDKLFDALKTKQVDMIISSITITTERAQTMDFSNPYFNAGQVVLTTIDKANTIKGLEALADKKIGVQIETTSETEAKKYTDPSFVIAYENYDLAKEALLNGTIDAIIIDYPAAVGMISQEKSLKIVWGPFTQEFYGIAVRKDETRLLEEINKTLRKLKREGELKNLEEKWLTK
jgi:polar amino acid transport system substrate-binding protein